MTDAEKVAAIRDVLEDLAKLHRHFLAEGKFGAYSGPNIGALRRIAEIVENVDYA